MLRRRMIAVFSGHEHVPPMDPENEGSERSNSEVSGIENENLEHPLLNSPQDEIHEELNEEQPEGAAAILPVNKASEIKINADVHNVEAESTEANKTLSREAYKKLNFKINRFYQVQF